MESLTGHTPKARPKRKAGRKKGKAWNERDYAVLQKIAIEGFQTYKELRATLMSHVVRDYVWRRLKHLVKVGWLVEVQGDGGAILGWSISKKGEEKLLERGRKGWRPNCHGPQYRSSYGHDIVVREVKEMLFESPVVRTWTPEHVIRKDIMSRISRLNEAERKARLSKIPDALFDLQISGKRYRCALEVELARKSRKRIYERIEAHVVNPDLDFIFFVVSDENHFKVLWEVYQQVLANSYRVKLQPSRNGIYFTLIEKLRKDRLDTNFIGLKQSFSFASFRM